MVQLNRQPCCGLQERPRRDQLNLRALKQASRDKRLLVAEFLPWTFFHRMLAHSATIRSGAISLAFCRNASAKSVPSSSTTHLMAILASMTRVFNAPFALRAEEPQTVFDVALWSASKIGCQPIKRWFNLGRQRLTKDLAMLGFRGAPMACSPALQTGNEIVIKIAHMQISGHLSSMRSLISMIS